jgi:hypothetical protein
MSQRADYQLSEPAITNYCDAGRIQYIHLLEYAAGSRQRLGEDRRLIADRVGNFEEILRRERQKLGEGAIATAYPERCPLRAMTWV